MRAMEPIAKLDLAFSLLCLQHKYNTRVARLSKSISHTGDGHLYALMGILAWWLDETNGCCFSRLACLHLLLNYRFIGC